MTDTDVLQEVAGCAMCADSKEHGHVIILNHEGDDPTFSWDPQDPTAVAGARANFNRLQNDGRLMYKIDDKGERQQIREFEPQARRIIATPNIVGG